ncbi:MAG TPA: hypothetical protein VIV58_05690 [Kofleriaceae bacterium]
MNRLVERTHGADRATLRPVVGPGLAGTGPAEPLLVIDELREVVAAPSSSAEPSPPSPRNAHARGETPELAPPPHHPAPAPPLVSPRSFAPAAERSDAPTASETTVVFAPTSLVSPNALDTSLQAPSSVVAPAAAPGPTVATNPASRTARTATTPHEPTTGDQVIRVHIGRIDVRAPAPVAPPAAKRVAEPLPSVALGRYLDERGRRR